MIDILRLFLLAFGFALGCAVMRCIHFILIVMEAIGNSTKTFDEIKKVLKTDDRSLTWALDFMEHCMKVIRHPPDNDLAYQLNDGGRRKLTLSRY